MTPEDAKRAAAAIIGATRALTDAIQALGEVPAGKLYAAVMDKMELPLFERFIRLIVESGVVERRGDLLVWKGGRDDVR